MQETLFITTGFISILLALYYYTRSYLTNIGANNSEIPTPMVVSIKHPATVDPAGNQPDIDIESLEKKVHEEEALLEEAELYANMGLPAASINIAKEILINFSSNPKAWYLLLSCYSSLGRTVEFNKAALVFQQRHSNSKYWSKIQALGRTLDQSNPLYISNTDHNPKPSKESFAMNKSRSIGEILKEKGILTEMILQDHLSNYNREKHGRFGGFLLKNKAISMSQLNHALIAQQSVFA